MNKLKEGGEEVLAQLPTMKEIPEVIKSLDTGELCEIQNRRKMEEEEQKRLKERMKEKLLKEETNVDRIRMNIRKKCKKIKFETPPPYVPVEPVKKSGKLKELERSIRKRTFFDDNKTKEILEKAKSATRLLKYQHVPDAYRNEFGRIRF